MSAGRVNREGYKQAPDRRPAGRGGQGGGGAGQGAGQGGGNRGVGSGAEAAFTGGYRSPAGAGGALGRASGRRLHQGCWELGRIGALLAVVERLGQVDLGGVCGWFEERVVGHGGCLQ